MDKNPIKRFSEIALENIFKEYPNKISHSLKSKEDLKEPHIMYPIFYGSYDWHSSVHSHWLLVKVLRSYPALVNSEKIINTLNMQFSKEKAQGELQYLKDPINNGFERPYGWGWFLKLALEIKLLNLKEKNIWDENLSPIAEFFTQAFKKFFVKLDYPIRVGTHFNSAFGLYFAHEFATYINDIELIEIINTQAKKWFLNDSNMQVLEPCGDEFLSPVLMEALLLSKVLSENEFINFFEQYLPKLHLKQPATLFNVVNVSDRTDGKIAHLDGLNLSRAWCFREIAKLLKDPLKSILLDNANIHFNSAINNIEKDYMGSHWLGSFALLALESKID